MGRGQGWGVSAGEECDGRVSKGPGRRPRGRGRGEPTVSGAIRPKLCPDTKRVAWQSLMRWRSPANCGGLPGQKGAEHPGPRQRQSGAGPIGDTGGGGGWHKALVVGSVSLWRRLLASRP